MKSPSVPTNLANNNNEIDLQLHFKMQSQDGGLTSQCRSLSRLCEDDKEREQTKERRAKPKNWNNESNKDLKTPKTQRPPNSKFNSTPIQTKPFWEYKKEKKKAHLIILMFNCQIVYLQIPIQSCLSSHFQSLLNTSPLLLNSEFCL